MRSIDYHNQTKHFPGRYAKSLGYLDWDNQPRDVKEYETDFIKLNKGLKLDYPYESLYKKNPPQKITLSLISEFLKNSAFINAKKSVGHSSWYVRVNPSSGNLHPEEIYIVYKDSFYHFNPKKFSLEILATAKKDLVKGGFLVFITSIPLREAWKYGERALRYTLLDTGHLLASMRFSSNLLGLNMKKLSHNFKEIFKNFKYYENEEEFFEYGFAVYNDDFSVSEEIFNLEFKTDYKKLARDSIRWDIVYDTFDVLDKEVMSLIILKKELSLVGVILMQKS